MSSTRLSVLALSCALAAAPVSAQVEFSWLHQLDGAGHIYERSDLLAVAPNGRVVVNLHEGTQQLPSGEPQELQSFNANGVFEWSWYAVGFASVSDVQFDGPTQDLLLVGTAAGDIQVVRLNPAGAVLWQRSWSAPGGGNEGGRHIAISSTGNIVVSGQTSSASSVPPHRLVVLTYAPDGTLLWEAIVNSTQVDSGQLGTHLAVAMSGDIFATSNGGASANHDWLVTRLDAGGNEIWTRTLASPGIAFDSPSSIAVDSASNVYVSGYLGTNNQALVKWDPSGVVQWRLSGTDLHTGSARPTEVEVDVRNDVLLCGAWWNGNDWDAVLSKFDPAGQLLWQREWAGAGERSDHFFHMDVNAFGDVVAAGVTSKRLQVSPPYEESDALIVRYDRDGNERYVHRGYFSYLNSDAALDVRFGPARAVVYAGVTTNIVDGPEDALVVRMLEQGAAYCLGDGSSTACPCGNASAVGEGEGCTNSTFAGARLIEQGDANPFADTLKLRASGLPPTSPVLFVQGSIPYAVPIVFGDGLLCVNGVLVRLGVSFSTNGVATYPNVGNPPISASSGGTIPAGKTRYYQARYRDSVPFCTTDTFNNSNGVAITWMP